MSEWHVPTAALRAWADGEVSVAAAASVEQHLLGCPVCRTAVADLSAPALRTTDLEAAWNGIRERIEPPRVNVLGRTLMRLGLNESDAILLSSAPALTGAWISGLTLVVLLTVTAAAWAPGHGLAMFVVLAPLLPIAGVAAAYGTDVDPTHELTLAAPYSKLRLLLLRTGAVVATCVPLTLLAGVPVPGPWWVAVVWLVPAFAFVLITLATATFAPPAYAASAISLLWISLSLPALIRREPLELFEPTALMTYGLLALIAGAVFASRLRYLATDWRLG